MEMKLLKLLPFFLMFLITLNVNAQRNPETECSNCYGMGTIKEGKDCPDCVNGIKYVTEACKVCDGAKVIVQTVTETDENGYTVEYTEEVTCPSCNGVGEFKKQYTCLSCDYGTIYTEVTCPVCEGSGEKEEK